MLNISFLITSFTSILWVGYSLQFIDFQKILTDLNLEYLFQAICVCLLPPFILWFISSTIQNSSKDSRYASYFYKIFNELKSSSESNADFKNSLNSIEKKLQNFYTINEFNLLISDANEILSDIIKRSNSVSSAQMEHLWVRTSGGERWLMAKTFIETCSFQTSFIEHLYKKAQKDPLLKGSILEFYTHFKNLNQLLSSIDNKIFSDMLEYGAMGKVATLLAPIVSKLYETPTTETTPSKISLSAPQNKEPMASPSFNDETESFPSFLGENKEEEEEQDFFPKIQNDNSIETGLKAIREELLMDSSYTPQSTSFSKTAKTLHQIQEKPEFKEPHFNSKKIISLEELEKEINASPDNNYDEYAYPFGASKK